MSETKRVAVALSGGVDSSVSAALLQKEGYEVVGVFIKTWTVPWLPCTWREERRDAMRVAAQLQIPFSTVDLSETYEREVVDYMIASYREGNTPNPDVMCNKQVKFGGFYGWAMEQGFDYVATGHYAQVSATENGYQLIKGADENKDQSYFLWTVTQQQLARILFPIGSYNKTAVRALAEQFSLPTAQKKDSQGICFLGKVDMPTFLKHYIALARGVVLNTQGESIGTHEGALIYTIGQRHGFSIEKKTPETPPLYVIGKNIEQNTITVAPAEEAQERALSSCRVKDLHFIHGELPRENLHCMARIRYRQPLFPVIVKSHGENSGVVVLETPQPYVSKGQSIVFYDGEICLGGAVIG